MPGTKPKPPGKLSPDDAGLTMRAYRQFKSWMLGLAATGSAALLVPVFVELPPSAEKQCEVALAIEARYRDREKLTPPQRALYNDSVRELNECMQ
jgi:hypothetical protein